MAQAQSKPGTAKPEINLDDQPSAGTGKTKKIVIFSLIGLLAVGLGVTTFLLLRGHSGEESREPAKVEAKAILYVPFKPFVVNFPQKGPARFLQVEFYVTASSPAVTEALNLHTPAIRNDVITLLAGQTYEQASTAEGMLKLREDIKKAIQNILDQNKVAGTVDAVYFTGFVMQ